MPTAQRCQKYHSFNAHMIYFKRYLSISVNSNIRLILHKINISKIWSSAWFGALFAFRFGHIQQVTKQCDKNATKKKKKTITLGLSLRMHSKRATFSFILFVCVCVCATLSWLFLPLFYLSRTNVWCSSVHSTTQRYQNRMCACSFISMNNKWWKGIQIHFLLNIRSFFIFVQRFSILLVCKCTFVLVYSCFFCC